jgi:hypothetical protein
MLRRHIACQRDGQAARLIRNECRGRVTRRPYVRPRPPTYVTHSRPRGSIGSPPRRGQWRKRTGPHQTGFGHVSSPDPRLGPVQGSCMFCPRTLQCVAWTLHRGGPGPIPGVRACLCRFWTLLGGPVCTYRGPALPDGGPDPLLIPWSISSSRATWRPGS